jgi:hypothetical protein
MKQRIYIDTSVFGGFFDEEFAEHTIPLFDRLKNDGIVCSIQLLPKTN